MKKMAVFSCPGLGDGLVSLQLAYNLSLNGYEVDLFHEKNFCQLQTWVSPQIQIQNYPPFELDRLLQTYEKLFLSQDLNHMGLQQFIIEGKKQAPNRLFVLNPSPSKRVGQQAFYEDSYFLPDVSMVQNLFFFVKEVLKLKEATLASPLQVPKDLPKSAFDPNLIIIHPAASKQGKCWGEQKFIQLAELLEKAKKKVFFVMTEAEKKLWPEEQAKKIKSLASFEELALFLLEGKVFLGGDSGVGHLAAALGLKTLSLFRSKRVAELWRPGWGENEVVFPATWIPNFSGFRLRDQRWQKFISVKSVFKKLISL